MKKKFEKIKISAVFEEGFLTYKPTDMMSKKRSPLALDDANRDLHQPPIRELFEWFGLADELDQILEEQN